MAQPLSNWEQMAQPISDWNKIAQPTGSWEITINSLFDLLKCKWKNIIILTR